MTILLLHWSLLASQPASRLLGARAAPCARLTQAVEQAVKARDCSGTSTEAASEGIILLLRNDTRTSIVAELDDGSSVPFERINFLPRTAI